MARQRRWYSGLIVGAAVFAVVLGGRSGDGFASERALRGASAEEVDSGGALSVGECGSGNPLFVTSRYARYGSDQRLGGVVAASDTAAAARNVQRGGLRELASQSDVGAVYGLALDYERQQLYASAFYVRDVETGPGGVGGVYRIDVASGDYQLVATVPAGDGPHRLGPPSFDSEAMPFIGRVGIGDIDIDSERSVLFVADLFDQRIHVFSIPDMTSLGSFANGAANEDWSVNARMFGIGVRDGWIYHGVVDSRQDELLPGALGAYIYRSRWDGSEMEEVLRERLDYDRQPRWVAWSDELDWSPFPGESQPIVADIEFRTNGDLIVGLGNRHYWFNWGILGHGDLLATESVGVDRWRVVEDRDFYVDDRNVLVRPPRVVDETLLGALARFPGLDVVVTGGFGQWPAVGGLEWFSSGSGRVEGPNDGFEALFGDELIGVGDIESMCPPSITTDPTATATRSSATATATATATRVPEVTPPGATHRAYLPTVRDERCEEGYVDVVLVVDASTSMKAATLSGQSKMSAAVMASGRLVDLVHLGGESTERGDRVAVVGFNGSAWVQRRLMRRSDSLHAGLGELEARMAEGTRLDLALMAAAAVVGESRGATENQAAVVLLTDGWANRVPAAEDGSPHTTVLRAAAQVKALGASVYTIGFGKAGAVDEDLLRGVASDPGMYRSARRADALVDVYRVVAAALTCDQR